MRLTEHVRVPTEAVFMYLFIHVFTYLLRAFAGAFALAKTAASSRHSVRRHRRLLPLEGIT